MNTQSSDTYEELRARLDLYPNAMPKTEEGIEIEILRRLFEEGEAEIAVALPLMAASEPGDVESISLRVGKKSSEVSRILETMVKKGLIYLEDNEASIPQFSLLPFLHGFWEFSFDRFDPELSDLMQKYIFNYILPEHAKPETRLARLIPVGQSIDSQISVRPYDDVIATIESASSICVAPCACRTQASMAGNGCEHPTETCLFFNEYGEYLNRIGKGRRIDKEEAIEILTKCEEAGLIHMTDNVQRHGVICNCCGCSCIALKPIVHAVKSGQIDPSGQHVSLSKFKLVVDPELCSGCESCIEKCWTEALSVASGIVVHEVEKCIACGACAYICPTDALYLAPEPEEETEIPPYGIKEFFSQKKVG